jgi:tRNA-dihydrouridine synthase A
MARVKSMNTSINRRFCLAPMMDWSDSHCRMFWRSLTKDALLYTEMVTAPALINGDHDKLLRYNAEEHPIALQVGGSNTQQLAQAAKLAQQWGYDEINLNCGCPSDRVQHGTFGACLMAHPQLVADCIKAMQDACTIPVTVKHRIGIDDQEDYPHMLEFVETIAATGCKTFIVHARKAWLKGLSPKENRDIPPLRYELVYQLKKQRPDLEIIINGGIDSLEACHTHLQHVDGVMLGRSAYHNPFLLASVDQEFFGSTKTPLNREEVIQDYLPYIVNALANGTRLQHISRHILGLFHGMPGGRNFRRVISEQANQPNAGIEVLFRALAEII